MTAGSLPYVWSSTEATQAWEACYFDRGGLYGDGFFTTLLVWQGKVLNWPAHWQRLAESARRLGFPALDEGSLRRDLARCYRAGPSPQTREVVKIVITRGQGGRGYAPPSEPTPLRRIYRLPYPETVSGEFSGEVDAPRWDLSLSASPVQWGRQPLLAGLKHLNRLENVLAQQDVSQQMTARSGTLADAVMTDDREQVISTTQANLVLVKGDQLLTPKLDHCGVAGTCLRQLPQALTADPVTAHFALSATRLSWNDVIEAEAVFATNAVRGVMAVRFVRTSAAEHKKSPEPVLPIHQAWLKWQADTALSLAEFTT
ncbi:MAG: aminodeoxychorismate lyase [Hydrogenovibrio sp.]|uniref:aminodeoxychorismate lyase n=1 Tax=Hydrogenovibrio sp. TaxID=2065821 RepID=UPI00287088BA|nr:aminodeoxychorismate lyase [Hydrogenovibrio sp.]MDR9498068.1 aminodeoxychorismate lyase [Hydrogenovibrio sp.]